MERLLLKATSSQKYNINNSNNNNPFCSTAPNRCGEVTLGVSVGKEGIYNRVFSQFDPVPLETIHRTIKFLAREHRP